MEFNQSINYMEKRGNLKGFSDDQKEEFIKVCNSNFFFYNPYLDVLFNPITSKKYFPKSLQKVFAYSNSSLDEMLSSKFPTKTQLDVSLDKLYSRKELAHVLYYRIIRNLKYLGFIIGGFLAYFIQFKLGLAVALYLFYFDYNTFDKVNGLIEEIQGGFMTAMIWQKKRNLYYWGSFLLLLGSLACLYLLTNSIYIVFGVFFVQKFFLVNPIVQFIASSCYFGTEVVVILEEELEKLNRRNAFLDAFPEGIKIKGISFYGDTVCEYEEVEELKIFYETFEDEYCAKHLFVYSKEPIKKENLDGVLMTDGVAKQLLRIDNDDRVQFYFAHIPNKPTSTYFVIAKEDFMSINEFEGTNSRCIVKSFHENGKINNYQEYHDGIIHGKMMEFHNNGQKHFECDFDKGLLRPSYYEWKYEDGSIMMSGSLRKIGNRNPEQKDLYDPNSEFRIGKWEVFEKDGSLIKSVEYKHDGERQTLVEDKEYHKNGVIWL